MHAYLITGADKQTRAKKLEEILEQNGVVSPPGQRFVLGETEASIKIEDIREAEKWLNLKRNRPAGLIVEEADRLTLPAQHAFLKTLEEPGENILIVLTAADASSLLPTVRSRCKIIRLPAATSESAEAVKFAKLNAGTTAERLVGLYSILREVTGSTAGLHRGAVKRAEAIMFIEAGIATSSRPSVGTPRNDVKQLAILLEAATTAHRRLKNNLNPTLTLHQFILDISPVSD